MQPRKHTGGRQRTERGAVQVVKTAACGGERLLERLERVRTTAKKRPECLIIGDKSTLEMLAKPGETLCGRLVSPRDVSMLGKESRKLS